MNYRNEILIYKLKENIKTIKEDIKTIKEDIELMHEDIKIINHNSNLTTNSIYCLSISVAVLCLLLIKY
jgi:hypothetical protein